MWVALLVVPGFVLLFAAADALVRGATTIAKRLRVSDLVIGLTVVAFGTSTPELVVSLFAAAGGDAGIAVGNILGSNTFNILVILGVSAVIYPLSVGSGTVWKEIPLSLLAVLTVAILGNNGLIDGGGGSSLTRTDGLVLLSFFVIFLYYVFSIAKAGRASEPPATDAPTGSAKAIGLIVLGLIGLNLGAKLTVDGAVALAVSSGVSQSVIGFTIVAAGTSLPELATSAVAAWRKNPDLAVGNIVGSNIFNVFCILGLGALVRPLPLQPETNLDIAATVVASVLLFVWMFTGRKPRAIERWEGIVCLVLYAGYLTFRLIVR